MIGRAFIVISLVVMFAVPAEAQQTLVGKVTNLPIPRYVSIRADEANLRVGPGGQYPVRWRLMRAGMPVRIVDEEEQWREVELYDGERGWLFGSLLSGARTLYVTDARAPLLAKGKPKARVVAFVEKGVVLRAKRCEPGWCEVRKGDVSGWVSRSSVWGFLPNEVFD
jgi:SH3-like domain-containing protein